MNDKANSKRAQDMDLTCTSNETLALIRGEGFFEPAEQQLADKEKESAAKSDELLLRDLLEKIVDQDQAAFSSLYETMLARVYSLAFKITRCVQTAEEVVEDTFWQIWRQAPRFDSERGTAVTWILTIARSRALDALRQADNSVDDAQDIDQTIDLVAPDVNPQDLLSAIQEGNRLHTALATLDPLTQQLIALSFFRGLSHDEIAIHNGLPLGTVKSQIRRALMSLKQILSNAPEQN